MSLKLVAGFVISLILVLVLMPKWIQCLKSISFHQSVSEYSLKEYKEKAKTPIMGGVIFILVPILVTLILVFQDLKIDILVVLLVFAGYGAIGFLDDYLIAIRKINDGLRPKYKFILQVLLAVIFYAGYRSHADLSIVLPFTNGFALNLGFFYSILILFMFTGASNAVNLTDGMDGLSAGCVVFSLFSFFVIALIKQNLSIAIFISSLLGALFGYLHFNIKPAKIFMGDTGSLALGAVLAALAMVLKVEIAFIFIGGVFVIETLCVMIQIGSVKLRGKRVFPYTPIHYSFVIKGIGEKQTVSLFWVASFIFSCIGLWIALH